jgi:DNA-binding MarR family transcriptional regulator
LEAWRLDIHEQLSEYFSIWKETDALYGRFAKISGISDTAFWVLYCMRRGPQNPTQKSIREQWTLSKQTVNSALKELERKHIISLCGMENDRRSKRIVLTEAGVRFMEKYIDAVCGLEERVFQKMNGSEREAMIQSSKRYLELLREESAGICNYSVIARFQNFSCSPDH